MPEKLVNGYIPLMFFFRLAERSAQRSWCSVVQWYSLFSFDVERRAEATCASALKRHYPLSSRAEIAEATISMRAILASLLWKSIGMEVVARQLVAFMWCDGDSSPASSVADQRSQNLDFVVVGKFIEKAPSAARISVSSDLDVRLEIVDPEVTN